ncbi:hypothetical protein [uncultured Rikenella sp.]|nr:hypothetical protein [uncultured Rikenella sp.]
MGNNGFSYSSSVSESDGTYFGFSMTGLLPSSTFNRAYGFPLRCLSE